MGLLKWVRKMVYKYQYGQLFSWRKRSSSYKVNYKDTSTIFSLEDPYSLNFFSTYFKIDVYEKEGLDVLFKEIKRKDVVFDVGANIGYFACLIANHYPESQVHAFEMGSENLRLLQRNVELNRLRNIITTCCAISDTSGKVKVVDSPVGNAVLKIIDNEVNGYDLIQVDSISLDDYCFQKNVNPDIIKIDVEGAEMKVLQGMSRILSGPVKLLIEIHEKELRQFNSSKEEVLDYLKSNQFSLRFIGNDQKKNVLVLAVK